MPQPTQVRLAVPRSPPLGPRGVPIHWRVSPGDTVGPNDVLAVLGSRTKLFAPDDVSGRIEKWLAADGERVINRQPLLRITTIPRPEPSGPAHAHGPTEPGGLAEPSAMSFEGNLPDRMVVERMDQRTHRTLAVLGGVTVIGLAVAVLCMPIYLIVGGPTVPAIGGLALAIVAAALAYGERILRERDG